MPSGHPMTLHFQNDTYDSKITFVFVVITRMPVTSKQERCFFFNDHSILARRLGTVSTHGARSALKRNSDNTTKKFLATRSLQILVLHFRFCKMGSRRQHRKRQFLECSGRGRGRDGGLRRAASRPPGLPVGLGAKRTRTVAPGCGPRLASRRPARWPKGTARGPARKSLSRSTAMCNRNTHVGLSARHFREAGKTHPNQSRSATARAAPPLKDAGLPNWAAHASLDGGGVGAAARGQSAESGRFPRAAPPRLREC